MPRPLRQPQPSSSVARLLDVHAAARAVSPSAASPQPGSVQRGPAPAPWPERPTTDREVQLTPSADRSLSRLVELYRRSTGTRLTTSHVARALLKGIDHCMDTLEREAGRLGPMRLPSNARGSELARERFEARIADAFLAGIRAAAAFDPDEDPRVRG